MKGKYIAVESLDGAGKTTYLNMLKRELQGKYDIKYVQEPWGTIGKYIKEHEGLTKDQLLMLFTVQRITVWNRVIKPALDKGKIVISDRSIFSMLAYNLDGDDYVDYIFNAVKHEGDMKKYCPDYTLPEVVYLNPKEELRQMHLGNRDNDWLDNNDSNHIKEQYMWLSWYYRKLWNDVNYDNDDKGYEDFANTITRLINE